MNSVLALIMGSVLHYFDFQLMAQLVKNLPTVQETLV